MTTDTTTKDLQWQRQKKHKIGMPCTHNCSCWTFIAWILYVNMSDKPFTPNLSSPLPPSIQPFFCIWFTHNKNIFFSQLFWNFSFMRVFGSWSFGNFLSFWPYRMDMNGMPCCSTNDKSNAFCFDFFLLFLSPTLPLHPVLLSYGCTGELLSPVGGTKKKKEEKSTSAVVKLFLQTLSLALSLWCGVWYVVVWQPKLKGLFWFSLAYWGLAV